jgi:hypothetical protein
MVDTRGTFKLEAVGALTVGVKDRENATFVGTLTNLSAVVGTAPTGGPLTFELRKEGAVVSTGTIAAGTTEVNVDLIADINNPTADPNNPNPQPTPTPPPADNPLLRFKEGDTFDLNITVVGVTVAGSDLDVTVAYSSG